MTKKEFNLLADALHQSKPDRTEYQYAAKYTQWHIDVRVIGMTCAGTNERFDMDKFVERCMRGV